MAKRIFDLILAILCSIILIIPSIIIAVLMGSTSSEKILYWSERVGKNKVNFMMPKFTTMRADTPSLATHLLSGAEEYYIPFGFFLRKTSLDEIPQLWSIITGKMSFVGPRPALFNQHDLVKLRDENGINQLMPGLTGWAQVNGRDELSIPQKVQYDLEYKLQQSFIFDIKILLFTARKILWGDNISH